MPPPIPMDTSASLVFSVDFVVWSGFVAPTGATCKRSCLPALVAGADAGTASQLQPRGCSREAASSRLQPRRCGLDAAVSKLQLRGCSLEAAASRLHPGPGVLCTLPVATAVQHTPHYGSSPFSIIIVGSSPGFSCRSCLGNPTFLTPGVAFHRAETPGNPRKPSGNPCVDLAETPWKPPLHPLG